MTRAARHKTGSVVFDKRRKTWNFLWWEHCKRRSRQIGTFQEFRTKGAAWDAALASLPQLTGQPSERQNGHENEITVRALATRYEAERMPSRYSTARGYRQWLRNYVLPQWGDTSVTQVQPRPVELWIRELQL